MTTLIPTLIPITMALTEEEWTARASKYRYRINADKASKDKLVEFIQTTIYFYNEQDLIDTNLWTVFQKQYKGFTAKSFKKIHTNIRFILQKHLFKKGVYIGKNSNKVPIYELLYEVLQQKIQPKQTDKNIKQTIEELAEPLLTKVLQKKLNPICDGLATNLSVQFIATTPLKTQIPTRTTPQPLITFIPQQFAQFTAIVTTPLEMQIPTPTTAQPPIAFIPQQPAQLTATVTTPLEMQIFTPTTV